MAVRIEQAKYIRDFVIQISFSDGSEGEVDLKDELHGEVFEPLNNKTYFANFVVHPELQTIVWPNGADFAPEFLLRLIHVRA